MKTAMRWLGFVLVFGMLFGASGCWWHHHGHHDEGNHYGQRKHDDERHGDDQKDNGLHRGHERQRDYDERR